MKSLKFTRLFWRCVTAMALTLTVICAGSAAAQPQPPPAEIAAAQRQFQAEDFKGAIATLEAFYGKNPTSVAGLQILGDCHLFFLGRSLTDYGKGWMAFEQSPHSQPDNFVVIDDQQPQQFSHIG